MFYVYILQSLKDNRIYVGYTKNIMQRFCLHQNGRVKSTKNRRPLKILKTEIFTDEVDAKKRELWWKSSVGRRKLKEVFENYK